MLKNIIQLYKQKQNYQLFGIDYILDEKMDLHLINVRTMPIFDVKETREFSEKLLDDTFKLTVDKMFKIKNDKSKFVFLKQY